MEEEKSKKKQKKKAVAEEGGEEKVHKVPWQEKYATLEEIKGFLSNHIYLRYNTVKHRVEARLPAEDAFCQNSELTEFASDDYQPMSDRLSNTLLTALCTVKPARARDLQTVLDSGFVTAYHPFRHYLNRLPPWDGQDHILALSVSVMVRGGTEKQMLFYEYLKKWLVAMVASWLDDGEVNQAVLVLIGDQGIYKTTWFSHLLPPELRDYFRIKVNSSRVGKDDLITLSQYGLVCYEELDVMTPSNVNTMKSVVTMPAIDERPAYGHYTEHMPHVASFCGTGNNVQFLTDVTGNRRWLPFIVESITSPREAPFDYEGVYAQAYTLYRQGFRHYFSKAEEEVLKEHNRTFETPQSEQEAIMTHFHAPRDGERGDFYTATDILGKIGYNPALRITIEKIGSAMKALGFKRYRSHGRRGYRLVAYKPEEIEMNRRMLACDARPEDEDDGGEGDRGDT
jgi:predicted P-loop ATPase